MSSTEPGKWKKFPFSGTTMPLRETSELRKITKQLDQINLQHVEDKILSRGLQVLHAYLPTRTINTAVGQSWFRVRTHAPKKIKNTSGLKSPQASYVKGYQRCNRPGNPMFYASDHPTTALSESNLEVDQEIYLSQWCCHEKIPINHTMVPALSDPNEPVQKGEEFLVGYLREKFTERISMSFSHKYKLTACMAEFLTTNLPEDSGLNILDDGLVGLVYPSVQDQSGRWNVALHPTVVERSLDAAHVIKATVTSITPSGFRLRIEDTSQSIEGSAIIWSGKTGLLPSGWPLKQSASSKGEYEL